MPPEITNLLFVFVRQALLIASGMMVARGWISSEGASSAVDAWTPVLVPLIPMVFTVAYGLWKSTLREKMKSILNRKNVSSIHVDPDLAAKIALPDVVPTPPAGK